MIKVLLPVFIILCLLVDPNGAKAQVDQKFSNGQSTPVISFPGGGCLYHWVNNNPAIGLPASGTGTIPSFTAINNGNVPITANITATPVPRGFAYISNQGDGTVSVINTTTHMVVAVIPVGANPFGVAISSDSKLVYVANKSGTISIINTGTNIVSATLTAGTSPYAICLSPDNSTIYVADYSSGQILVANALNGQLSTAIPVAPSPYALTMSTDGKYVFVAHNSQPNAYITVITTSDNQAEATIPVAAAPNGLAVSPNDGELYATISGSNIVDVINTQTDQVAQKINVGQQPEGITISHDGSKLYVTNNKGNSVSVVSLQTGAIVTVPVGAGPTGIAEDADGSSVYVTNEQDNTVSVISTATNTVRAVIPVGKNPDSQGNFLSSATACAPVSFTITVEPDPEKLSAVMAGKLTGNLSGCIGNLPDNDAVGHFTASGSNLSVPVNVTASAGFEVSISPFSGFSTSLTLTTAGSTLSPINIYARLSAGNGLGQVNGEISLSSAGSVSATVPLNAIVTTMPVINAINNQSYFNGDPVPVYAFGGKANNFTWTNDMPGIGLAASGTGDLPAFTAINNGTTPVVATITVTPLQTSYAYIPNSTGNNVTVINTVINAVVANIPVGRVPNAAAVSPDGLQVYVVNTNTGQAGTISVIDASTNAVTKTITVGSNPWGVAVNPNGKEFYVTNESSNSVSVISTSTLTVTAMIPVQIRPVGVTVSPDGKYVYVANSGSNSISVISTSLEGVINEIPVGQGPYIAQVTPDGSKLYVPNGTDNTVSVINAADFNNIATIKTPGFPINITISPDGSLAYLITNTAAQLTVINTSSNTIVNTIGVLANPVGIDITQDGQEIFVVGRAANEVGVYSATNDQLLGYISTGTNPFAYGDFIGIGSACSGEPKSFTITVYPRTPPAVVANGQLSRLSTTYGTPSASDTFKVSGSGITTAISVNAPSGFEISTDNSNFNGSLTVNGLGVVTPVTIYIRLAAIAPVGLYNLNPIVVSSKGATSEQLTLPASEVNPATLTITANNQSRIFHTPNPPFTVSYQGFENGDGPSQLATLPIVTTIATINSPLGTYGLIPSGAVAANYAPAYVDGTLTITPLITPVIPNTFTPNGDNINDTWIITHIEAYPACKVSIFNRYGSLLFYSVGYPIPWNGEFNGTPVPSGTYYYIIDLHNHTPLLSGSLTVIR